MCDVTMSEILAFNKPYRWTSFNLVSKVRGELSRRLGVKKVKVGHAGTLDPLATGVLIVCTGKATKEIDRLQAGTKEYVASIKLGATTPSFDMETAEDAWFPTEQITRERAEEVLSHFIGEIHQIPPVYSAVKVDGTRAFKYARTGTEVELKPKTVHIDCIDVTDFNPETMQLSIRVGCGKGTYIRSLARDIGRALNSGAYLTALCRTRLGDVSIDDCITLDDFPQWLENQTIETSE